MHSLSILFIIINYFNEKDVKLFIDQLSLQDFKDYKVAIINNGSIDDGKLKAMLTGHSNILFYYPGKNLGYLPGMHYGLQQYITEYKNIPDQVIVCNTDITIADAHFLNDLNKLRGDIIGPSIISTKTNNNQNPFLITRISKKKLRLLKFIFDFYLFYTIYQALSLIKSSLFKNNIKNNKSQDVYALHGSFIVFRKNFFEAGGTLNYPSFLFGEELYIAESAIQLKLTLIFHPTISVQHHEHHITNTFKPPHLVKRMNESIIYLLNTYFS